MRNRNRYQKGEMMYVLQRYSSSDAFLKLDGKPVVFVYGG